MSLDAETLGEPTRASRSNPIGLARHLAATPFIYAVLLPLLVLDAFVSLYQSFCFRLWRLPRAKRSAYFRIDRHRLEYLNPVQKLNCVYCGYANGVLAFAAEVASRTEQYWCPIQHETPTAAPHKRYAGFVAYGDRRDLQARWGRLRDDLARGRD
jgi:hypothetical protein